MESSQRHRVAFNMTGIDNDVPFSADHFYKTQPPGKFDEIKAQILSVERDGKVMITANVKGRE